MKRILFSIFCFLSISSSRIAAQDLTLSQFLEKAKGLYYDHAQGGLKGFQCEASDGRVDKIQSDLGIELSADDERAKALKKVKFKIRVQGDKVSVSSSAQQLTGNEKFDLNLSKVCSNRKVLIRGLLEQWVGLDVPGILCLDKKKRPDFKIAKTEGGYEVSLLEDGAVNTLSFGRDLKLTGITQTKNDETLYTIKTDVMKGPKGWMIGSWEVLQGDTALTVHVTYRTEKGFELPDQITMRSTSGGSGEDSSPDTISFQNYRINP